MLSYRICGWSVINLFSQLKHGVNPIPVILAETFRSLNHCRTEEEGRFVGCAPLLDIWMQSHLKCIKDRFTRPYFPENRIQIKDFFSSQWPGPYIQQPGVDWNPQPYGRSESCVESTLDGSMRCDIQMWQNLRVPLLRLWGAISYAPAMVRRQIGSKQFITSGGGLRATISSCLPVHNAFTQDSTWYWIPGFQLKFKHRGQRWRLWSMLNSGDKTGADIRKIRSRNKKKPFFFVLWPPNKVRVLTGKGWTSSSSFWDQRLEPARQTTQLFEVTRWRHRFTMAFTLAGSASIPLSLTMKAKSLLEDSLDFLVVIYPIL